MGRKLPAVDPGHKPTWSDGRADPPPASLEAALSRKPYRPLATPEHSRAYRLGLPLRDQPCRPLRRREWARALFRICRITSAVTG